MKLENTIENINTFESIKHLDEKGNEFWYARELQPLLDYKEWRKFENVINKAKIACINSNNSPLDHFVGADKMICIAKGGKRKIIDYKLSRYACYLIAQNGDSRKKVIALAQTYFAHQTRKQELFEEEYKLLSEDEKRLNKRKKVRTANHSLNQIALESGVKRLAEFHNYGYRGLYNGETADDIFKRKGLRYREDILDNMGSEELVDNWFRIVQTEAKINREKIKTESEANVIHYQIGKEVRQSIKNMGGTMPEDLPTPSKSIKELNSSVNKKQLTDK